MEKILLYKRVVPALFLVLLMGAGLLFSVVSAASEIHDVYPGQSIQNAINISNPGDTVFVHNGLYNQRNILINKNIILTGENKLYTIIDAGGIGDVIHITSATGCTVKKLTIQGSGEDRDGIYVESWFCSIRDNLLRNNGAGIALCPGSQNTISGNRIENNVVGIYFFGAQNNIITDNTIQGNTQRGILMEYYDDFPIPLSTNNRIYHNNMYDAVDLVNYRNTNIWDAGFPGGGNFWLGHYCVGNPSSGDYPYHVSWNDYDRYPFESPFGWVHPKILYYYTCYEADTWD